jgi:hypothetical protein
MACPAGANESATCNLCEAGTFSATLGSATQGLNVVITLLDLQQKKTKLPSR